MIACRFSRRHRSVHRRRFARARTAGARPTSPGTCRCDVRPQRRRAAAAVSGDSLLQCTRPPAAERRRQQRLRHRLRSRSHPRFTISSRSPSASAEVSQHERSGAMTAPSGRRAPARRITGSVAPQMRSDRGAARTVRVAFALREIELAALERLLRRPATAAPPGPPDPSRSGTATRNSRRPVAIGALQLRLVIREIQERRRRREFLPLEQHRRRRTEQRQRRQRPQTAGRGDAGAADGRTACWRPDRGSPDRRRTRAAADRAPACRAAASASRTTAPDRGSRTSRTR